MRDTKKKLAVAVRAAGTSLTGLFGVGPVIAATVIGDVRDVSRFPGPGHFAAWNGTAPAEVSSGKRKTCRLSRRGNRRVNHAIHMAAVTQIRYRHSTGRAYYDKKRAEGKTGKQALRALKRQISDVIFARLQAGARHAAASTNGPGGQPGNDSGSSAAGSHPAHRVPRCSGGRAALSTWTGRRLNLHRLGSAGANWPGADRDYRDRVGREHTPRGARHLPPHRRWPLRKPDRAGPGRPTAVPGNSGQRGLHHPRR
jgi:hypothetical protein